MRLINTKDHYGLISILLHWSVALLTIGLFVLGLWMVDLGYYDDWYYQAPWWHKGLGFIVFLSGRFSLALASIGWKARSYFLHARLATMGS